MTLDKHKARDKSADKKSAFQRSTTSQQSDKDDYNKRGQNMTVGVLFVCSIPDLTFIDGTSQHRNIATSHNLTIIRIGEEKSVISLAQPWHLQ